MDRCSSAAEQHQHGPSCRTHSRYDFFFPFFVLLPVMRPILSPRSPDLLLVLMPVPMSQLCTKRRSAVDYHGVRGLGFAFLVSIGCESWTTRWSELLGLVVESGDC